MHISPREFSDLLSKWLSNSLSARELDLFVEALRQGYGRDIIGDSFEQDLVSGEYVGLTDDHQKQAFLKRLMQQLPAGEITAQPARRIKFPYRAILKYAAVLLVAGGLAFYFMQPEPASGGGEDQAVADTRHSDVVVSKDIHPGSEKAILTLSDGQRVELNPDTKESIVDGSVAISNQHGTLAYGVSDSDAMVLNTMSTPRGGQYRLMLADGTRVWLNAASSITYPTAFADKQRVVKITGEVYFEVEKDPQKPFIVDVGGKSIVQVLGTSFNINSYADEDNIKTTLLEGSVQIDSSVVLKPGQQGQVLLPAATARPERVGRSNKDIIVVSDVNVDQALAWKNGFFDFDGLDIRDVMHQLERWYDVTVRYEGPIENSVFKGKINRKVSLSDILGMLQEIGVKCQINERTIVIH